jgi:protein TonB
MLPHVDILDQRESLQRPLLFSVGLHVGIFSWIALVSWMGLGRRELWGDPNSLGGGAVGINVVSQIPMPTRAGDLNPVANDTQSTVPLPPDKGRAARRQSEPDDDAIAIKGRNEPRSKRAAARQRYRAKKEENPNQLYSSTGQALVSPMFGQAGAGGVGVGGSSPFGNRYGYYVDLLRQKVAEKWRTGDVDPRVQTAPIVIITFVIRRDGSVSDVRIVQRSGIGALDYSAQRAIYEASPFQPLPSGYERNEAQIEFQFQLRR